MHLKPPVFYFKRNNFNSDGTLKPHKYFKNKKVIIFIHTGFCGYCIDALPQFQKAADLNKNKNTIFGAIKLDGDEPGEQECSEICSLILKKEFQGVPDYALLITNKPVLFDIRDRSAESILYSIKRHNTL